MLVQLEAIPLQGKNLEPMPSTLGDIIQHQIDQAGLPAVGRRNFSEKEKTSRRHKGQTRYCLSCGRFRLIYRGD